MSPGLGAVRENRALCFVKHLLVLSLLNESTNSTDCAIGKTVYRTHYKYRERYYMMLEYLPLAFSNGGEYRADAHRV